MQQEVLKRTNGDITTISEWHVLRPETMKRNGRKKQNDWNKRNDRNKQNYK